MGVRRARAAARQRVHGVDGLEAAPGAASGSGGVARGSQRVQAWMSPKPSKPHTDHCPATRCTARTRRARDGAQRARAVTLHRSCVHARACAAASRRGGSLRGAPARNPRARDCSVPRSRSGARARQHGAPSALARAAGGRRGRGVAGTYHGCRREAQKRGKLRVARVHSARRHFSVLCRRHSDLSPPRRRSAARARHAGYGAGDAVCALRGASRRARVGQGASAGWLRAPLPCQQARCRCRRLRSARGALRGRGCVRAAAAHAANARWPPLPPDPSPIHHHPAVCFPATQATPPAFVGLRAAPAPAHGSQARARRAHDRPAGAARTLARSTHRAGPATLATQGFLGSPTLIFALGLVSCALRRGRRCALRSPPARWAAAGW
jgi:hypothetical protein